VALLKFDIPSIESRVRDTATLITTLIASIIRPKCHNTLKLDGLTSIEEMK
jgi:hypothetical protein